MCLFINITGYRLNMLWFWDKRLLLLSLNFISLCLAPSITHSAFSDVFFAPVFSDKSRSVYHCVSSQMTKPGLALGGGRGGMEAEHDFFWMPLLHSNNPKRELLECSPRSACHQKILGFNTHHRQLHKTNEAAKIHGYGSKPFQSRQIGVYCQFRKRKVCVCEREKAASAPFPAGSLAAGRQQHSWQPQVPTSGGLLLSTGPLRSERCCFLGCSKPLHICKEKREDFRSFCFLESFKTK